MNNTKDLNTQATSGGTGGRLYGKIKPKKAVAVGYITEEELKQYPTTDESYIATSWITLFDIPLIPLKTYLVISKNKSKSFHIPFLMSRDSFDVIPLKKLFWRQIITTYLLIPVFIALFLVIGFAIVKMIYGDF